MDIEPLVCVIISSGRNPVTHELWAAFAVVFRRANGRVPTVADLYASAACPCCF